VPPEQRLRIGSKPGFGRLEVGDGLSTPDHGEMLASVLDRIEEVGEVSGCFGRTYLRHAIRLSDVANGGFVGVGLVYPPTYWRAPYVFRSKR
jgi:hypothetical protein